MFRKEGNPLIVLLRNGEYFPNPIMIYHHLTKDLKKLNVMSTPKVKKTEQRLGYSAALQTLGLFYDGIDICAEILYFVVYFKQA